MTIPTHLQPGAVMFSAPTEPPIIPRTAIEQGIERPCVACLHHRHETVGPEYPGEHVCTHSAVRQDVVTKRVVPHNVPCREARGRDGACGLGGVHWEPKP